MHRRFIYALLVIFPTAFVLADCSAAPECIADMCLRDNLTNLPTEASVKKLIGSSRELKISIPHRKSSCHVIATPKYKEVYAHMTYINARPEWRLISLTVASQRLCDNPETLSVAYEFATEKGVGLGSSEEEIIAAYGKPTYLLESPSSGLINSYFPNAVKQDAYSIVQYVGDGDDMLTSRFFLLQGRVVGIDISADE